MAYSYGKQMRWSMIGEALSFAGRIVEAPLSEKDPATDCQNGAAARFSFDHIKRLTDDTGIVQHARYGIPNLKEGYCLDEMPEPC